MGRFPWRTKARDDLGGCPLRKSGAGVVSGQFPWQNMTGFMAGVIVG